jgi:hypothetical protein
MNLAQLQNKLMAAARAHPPGADVPYAFEKRVMARLALKTVADGLALWNRTLWQAVTPCMAIVLLLGVWTFVAQQQEHAGPSLAAELEESLYLAFDAQTDVQ